jgi:hypothetical protein
MRSRWVGYVCFPAYVCSVDSSYIGTTCKMQQTDQRGHGPLRQDLYKAVEVLSPAWMRSRWVGCASCFDWFSPCL